MKTKTQISFAVTAKLICVLVFAYAKIRFSHDEAHYTHVYTCNDENKQVWENERVTSMLATGRTKAVILVYVSL